MNILATDSNNLRDLKQRLQLVRENIALAAEKSGRCASDITLIAVSKFFSADTAAAAVRCGLEDLGENRVQEFLPKAECLRGMGLSPRWHLIGTLQTNKIKYILGQTSLIHSVDRLRLLRELAKASRNSKQVTDILLQVNMSREDSKHGFLPEDLFSAAEVALQLEGIRLRGLMTMAPLTDDPESLRPLFTRTSQLFQKIGDQLQPGQHFNALSMGMTQDYRQAIECGATHVRIGTAIFGSRL